MNCFIKSWALCTIPYIPYSQRSVSQRGRDSVFVRTFSYVRYESKCDVKHLFKFFQRSLLMECLLFHPHSLLYNQIRNCMISAQPCLRRLSAVPTAVNTVLSYRDENSAIILAIFLLALVNSFSFMNSKINFNSKLVAIYLVNYISSLFVLIFKFILYIFFNL